MGDTAVHTDNSTRSRSRKTKCHSNIFDWVETGNSPSGQELTTKLATGFRQDHFRVRKPLNHPKMWTNYLSQVRDMTNH